MITTILGWYSLVMLILGQLLRISDDKIKGKYKVAGIFVSAPIIAYIALKLFD
jgi:hypothetical protein